MSSRFYDDDPHNQPYTAHKRYSSSRREPSAPQTAARRNHTTLRLPAMDPQTFHARTTAPRLQAQAQPEQSPLGSDLLLIAGPDRPARQPKGLSTRMRGLIMGLVLLLLLLVGAEGLVAQLSGDCSARAREQGNCFAMDVFTALSGSQQVHTSTASTPTAPKLPAIPNDLPNNVHSFIVLALPYAVQAHQQLGWPLSVILAQWGLEHGWSVPDAQGYNWGNTTFAPDCPYRGSRFCYAATPKEGLREYVYTARLGYYDGVRMAVPNGADSTALALGRSPWDAGHYGGATTPGSLLLEILRNFNFYRFDTAG